MSKPYICEQGFSLVFNSFQAMNDFLRRHRNRMIRENYALLRLPATDVRLELRAKNTLAWNYLLSLI